MLCRGAAAPKSEKVLIKIFEARCQMSILQVAGCNHLLFTVTRHESSSDRSKEENTSLWNRPTCYYMRLKGPIAIGSVITGVAMTVQTKKPVCVYL